MFQLGDECEEPTVQNDKHKNKKNKNLRHRDRHKGKNTENGNVSHKTKVQSNNTEQNNNIKVSQNFRPVSRQIWWMGLE